VEVVEDVHRNMAWFALTAPRFFFAVRVLLDVKLTEDYPNSAPNLQVIPQRGIGNHEADNFTKKIKELV
tara:strand:+ start:722 stop:928 length:207 start_codon:yes stop_codon:yes gene_type:complete